MMKRHQHENNHNQGSHDHNHTDFDHDHHNHDDHHDIEKELCFEDKLSILFHHWIEHNDSHKSTYLSWAAKAEEENMAETAVLLKDVAEESDIITKKLERALKLLHINRHEADLA